MAIKVDGNGEYWAGTSAFRSVRYLAEHGPTIAEDVEFPDRRLMTCPSPLPSSAIWVRLKALPVFSAILDIA